MIVVDDQPVVRAGFQTILDTQPDIEVVGEAADGLDAVEVGQRLRPDVVLMDIRMPVLDGLAATRAARRTRGGRSAPRPDAHDVRSRRVRLRGAARRSRAGFLLKDATREAAGARRPRGRRRRRAARPVGDRRLIAEFAQRRPVDGPAAARLEPPHPARTGGAHVDRSGDTNAEIAEELIVGEATVKTHVNRLFAKLHLRDRVQAVILAYEIGLVAPGTGSIEGGDRSP